MAELKHRLYWIKRMQSGMTSFVNTSDNVEVMMFDENYGYSRGDEYVRNLIKSCMDEFIENGMVSKKEVRPHGHPALEYTVIKKPE